MRVAACPKLISPASVLVLLATASTLLGKTIFVDVGAAGANNGFGWQHAYICLQDALDAAESGDEVRVAQGIYRPDERAEETRFGLRPEGSGDRQASFQLKNGVAIKGGYAGATAPDPNAHDIELYKTTLSGDLEDNDADVSDPCELLAAPSRADNSYHVVTGTSIHSTAVLDGFTISGGNANGSDPHNKGGGVSIEIGSSPTITNCVFTNNSAADRGGGMCSMRISTPTLTGCVFVKNAASFGGGIYNFGKAMSPRDFGPGPTLTDCIFERNYAYGGAGIHYDRSDAKLIRCTFSENVALQTAGGMDNGIGHVVLSDCIFNGNTAGYIGGGICNSGAANFLNCVLSENTAGSDGGAVEHSGPYSFTFRDCLFRENSAGGKGGAVYSYASGSLSCTSCTFTANTAEGNGGAIYNWPAMLTLAHCTFDNNTAKGSGGAICDRGRDSTSVARCTFVGNSAQSTGGAVYGARQYAILMNCIIAENTSESKGGGMYNEDGGPELTNCTICANRAPAGAGIYNLEGTPILTSCIVWGNTSEQINGTAAVTYSDIQGGWQGEGNIDTDPIMIDMARGDYHLSNDSPCVDAGDPTYCLHPGEVDIDGQPRIVNGRVDMGADEFCWEDPLIDLSSRSFELGRAVGAPNPEPLVLRVYNWGIKPLSWQITEECPWLDVHPGSGFMMTGPNEVTIDVDSSDLTEGNYACELIVSGLSAINSPQIVDVNLTIHQPFLDLSASTLQWIVSLGEPEPERKILTISTSGGRTIPWTIAYDCDWLQVNPLQGSVVDANQVALAVDVSGLSLGTYTTDFTISSPDLTDGPHTVSVVLAVCERRVEVPNDFDNIQAAIDHTLEGGTVVVYPGTYTGYGNVDIDFKAKAITVRSIDPQDSNVVSNTVIDCSGTPQEGHRGFNFVSGEGPDSILAGLTITNGHPIEEGDHPRRGGGIYCYRSSPTIAYCVIANNRSCDHSKGGGIYCRQSSPVIKNCTVGNNHAGYRGGGICCEEGTPVVRNSMVVDNQPEGIYCSSARIRNCTIAGNSASGIRCEAAEISNCIVWANGPHYEPPLVPPMHTTTQDSGQIQGIGTTIVSYSDVQGGWHGIGNIDADPCFVDPNNGDYHIAADSPCINAGDPNREPLAGETDIDGRPRVVDGWIDIGADETFAPGPMLSLNAQQIRFLALQAGPNPDGQVVAIRNRGIGTLNWLAAEDCPWLEVHPAEGTCIRNIDEVGVTVDTSGLSRGSYACQLVMTAPEAINSPQIIAVALEMGTKLSVPVEYQTIQEAIDAAKDADMIVLADGTYTGTGNRDIDFGGKAITVRSENGPENCIIDCNASRQEPHRGFYFHTREDADSVLDGFTIKNGHGPEGTAVLCDSASPTIVNCIMTDNALRMYPVPRGGPPPGYGMDGVLSCRNSNPVIQNCRLTCNRATAVSFSNCSNAVICNCTITANSAHYGAGICCLNSFATVRHCIISGNKGRYAGGICCWNSNPILENCVISGNQEHRRRGGGGIYCENSSPKIMKCTIISNRRRNGYGGAVCSFGDSSPQVGNCILWANEAMYGNQIAVLMREQYPQREFYSSATVTYSNVQRGRAAVFIDPNCTLEWNVGNIEADPLFAEPGDWDANGTSNYTNDDFWVDGDYRLKSEGWRWDEKRQLWTWDDVTSPCIDAGNPGSPLGDEPRAVPGDPDDRWGQNLRINMGAYGGTDQASIAPPGWLSLADLTNDGIVNLDDYAYQAGNWFSAEREQPGDVNRDGAVNFADVAVLAEEWLR